MNINVNAGHSRKSQGASKYLNEVNEARVIKDALISELKRRGHRVTDSTSEASTQNAVLAEQARKANNSGASLAVSIHFNSGGGTGTEVWYYPGTAGGKYAKAVSSSISKKLGIKDRGAKSSSELYWLRSTKMQAILIEVCFVDSRTDEKAYKGCNSRCIACAIADAIESV